jgi:D-alanine-D-alanine ligase
MSDVGRVLVLAGGLSSEREVSLRSGRRVTEALREVGVDAEVRDVDEQLLPALHTDPPDAVFSLLHGASGEDGGVRGVLEILGIPYVGAPASAARLAFDKPTAKAIVTTDAGLATPPALALTAETLRVLGAATLLEAVVARLGLPLVLKPARGGSALGLSVVSTIEEMPDAMMHALGYGDTVLVERFVAGTEVAVSVIDTGEGPMPLPAVEIVPDGGLYDYAARYTAGATEFFTPARLTPEVAAAAAAAAVQAHRVLGLRDLSRSDLVVDAHGTPWFLEVNVAPGMTDTSLLPLAAQAAGLDLGVLCRDLVGRAARRAG